LSEGEAKEITKNQIGEYDRQEKEKIKLSASYIPGLNYENNPPPFSFRTEHLGVVVHSDLEGIVVGLNNGWVGKIPKKSLLRGYELIPDFRVPSIGDDVVIVVHKIKHLFAEGAYTISLDTKEVSIANWKEIEKNNPIGSITRAKVVEKFKDEFVLSTTDGLRGSILALDVQKFLKITCQEGTVFNLWLDVQVIGFKPEKKCLLFSLLPELREKCERTSVGFDVGGRIHGTCKERKANFSVIELPFGELGILHIFNHWGKELPAIGEKIELSIVYKDDAHFNFVLATDPPAAIDRVFPPVVGTDEMWDEFMDHFRVGDALDVQVLFWAEEKQCFVVNTGLGVAGMLSPNELDWGTRDREIQKKLVTQGDVFKVSIKKIDPSKRKFSVSKKRFDSQLTYEKSILLKIGDVFDGTVVTVQEYGYFVWLPSVKVQGLLHITSLCDGESFVVGDSIKVRVENIDYPTRRVSLASALFK
jgi:ribosomal protein S1